MCAEVGELGRVACCGWLHAFRAMNYELHYHARMHPGGVYKKSTAYIHTYIQGEGGRKSPRVAVGLPCLLACSAGTGHEQGKQEVGEEEQPALTRNTRSRVGQKEKEIGF